MNGSTKVALGSAALATLLAGCALGQIGAVMHPTVAGSLDMRPADGAPSQWTPDRCASGDWNYFLGFDFSATHDPGQLRAIREPAGDILVRWTSPQGDRMFRSADCSQLVLEVRPTGWRVNEVREFAGHLELKCQSADGTSIAGTLTVDHCH